MLLVTGNDALMGSRLRLGLSAPLTLDIWCHDPELPHGRACFELWSTGGTLIETYETRGLAQFGWRVALKPRPAQEHWFVVRLLHRGATIAYSSPIWVRWS
jgi:hypothetical protein